MKTSHSADATFNKRAAHTKTPSHKKYAPSVPMSVYRELAAELRANKAVIDSLNDRNQQLLEQNQRLKQEIHSVVQATLNLGQFAGVAQPAQRSGTSSTGAESFPSKISPNTLAKLVRAQSQARTEIPAERELSYAEPSPLETSAPEPKAKKTTIPPRNRVPRPIPQASAAPSVALKSANHVPVDSADLRPPAPPKRAIRKKKVRSQSAPGVQSSVSLAQQTDTAKPKLFTEQVGEYRSSALDSQEEKEIGGIWLILSVILIIVTAFGAGFLIMKPLLNQR